MPCTGEIITRPEMTAEEIAAWKEEIHSQYTAMLIDYLCQACRAHEMGVALSHDVQKWWTAHKQADEKRETSTPSREIF